MAASRCLYKRRGRLDVSRRVQQYVQLKQRQRGLDEAGYVESSIATNTRICAVI